LIYYVIDINKSGGARKMKASDIVKICELLGINYTGLSEILGVSRSTVSRWCAGEREVSRFFQKALIKELDERGIVHGWKLPCKVSKL
jgi:DNA-binding transcriptional regulator YiaG